MSHDFSKINVKLFRNKKEFLHKILGKFWNELK